MAAAEGHWRQSQYIVGEQRTYAGWKVILGVLLEDSCEIFHTNLLTEELTHAQKCSKIRVNGCSSFFCATRLLGHARGKGLPSPAILSLRAPGLLACRLWCRRNGQARRMGLLPFGLVLKQALLLTGLTLEVALVLTQAVLLLPGL